MVKFNFNLIICSLRIIRPQETENMDSNIGIFYHRGCSRNVFEVCFISSLMVQLLYLKEDMPTEKYGTSITESRGIKLFKYN